MSFNYNANINYNGAILYNGTALPPKPATPLNLTGVGGLGFVQLTWNPSVLATSYNVYRSRIKGAEVLTFSGITDTSYKDTTVVPGVTYFYKVSAVNAGGESGLSNEVAVASLLPLVFGPGVHKKKKPTKKVIPGVEYALALMLLDD